MVLGCYSSQMAQENPQETEGNFGMASEMTQKTHNMKHGIIMPCSQMEITTLWHFIPIYIIH